MKVKGKREGKDSIRKEVKCLEGKRKERRERGKGKDSINVRKRDGG